MKYFVVLRPWQWFKNVLIFVPIILSGEGNLVNVFISFILFSFLASGNYIINDIKDMDLDKFHPKKQNRPIANGSIDLTTAKLISIFLIVLPVIFINQLINSLSLIFLLYFILVSIYTFYLKQIAFLNTLLLATFFQIRLVIGGISSGVEISNLLFLYIFLVSFLLGVLKKKSILFNQRVNLNEYKQLIVSENKIIPINIIIYITIFLVNLVMFLWLFENQFFQTKEIPYLVLFIFLHITYTFSLSKAATNSELEDFVIGIIQNKLLFFHTILLIFNFTFLYF